MSSSSINKSLLYLILIRNSLRDDPPSATSPPRPPAHEEREERIDLVPPPSPLLHRDAAEASGSAPPVSVLGSTSCKPRIPHPIHRELTQGFTEGMSPTDPQKGGGMPYYMGAFLAVAIKWRSQARNAIKGREALRKLRQEVGALKEFPWRLHFLWLRLPSPTLWRTPRAPPRPTYLLEGVLLQLPQLLELHQVGMKAQTTCLSSSPNPRRRHHAKKLPFNNLLKKVVARTNNKLPWCPHEQTSPLR